MAQILDFQAAALARSRCDPLSDESAPLVIVAGGGRALDWPGDQIAAAMLQASAGRPVLRDIDLLIRPGERVGLIGRSGAGKSTLAHLLLRFFDPVSGRILIDGQDLPKLKIV